jgi:hypothetical protein
MTSTQTERCFEWHETGPAQGPPRRYRHLSSPFTFGGIDHPDKKRATLYPSAAMSNRRHRSRVANQTARCQYVQLRTFQRCRTKTAHMVGRLLVNQSKTCEGEHASITHSSARMPSTPHVVSSCLQPFSYLKRLIYARSATRFHRAAVTSKSPTERDACKRVRQSAPISSITFETCSSIAR